VRRRPARDILARILLQECACARGARAADGMSARATCSYEIVRKEETKPPAGRLTVHRTQHCKEPQMASSKNGGDQPLVAPAGGANPPVDSLTEGLDDAAAAAPKETGETDREQAIREAAYAAYERRGKTEGNAEQDWLDAEAEVKARSGP
jgi:hypothetical protein